MAGESDPEPSPETLTAKIDGGGVATSSESRCCGICLVDGGATAAIRGEIDSCDHFFCFVCIMEWSKVESRCPLCKRRFGSILRPPVSGALGVCRLVKVPVRDQVYRISGNVTIGPPDPFSNIRCSICDSVGDENLLLLCDLCDSASHTHCVGLGATVPEGDWFCHDCTVSKAEHKKIQAVEDCDDPMEHLSIDDIVREARPRKMSRIDRIAEERSETNSTVTTSAPDFGARTLQRCRNVHARVQALRENWSAIRSGSVSFTSSSIGLCTNRNERSNQSHTSSIPQVPSESLLCVTKCSKSSYDVEKAWKMMNKAKSVKQAHEKTRAINQLPSSKITNPCEEARSSSFPVQSISLACSPGKHKPFHSCSNANARHKPQLLAKRNHGVESSSSISYGGQSYRFNADDRHKPQLGLKQELGGDSTTTKSSFNDNNLSSHSLRDHEPPSFRKFQTSIRGDSCENGGTSSQKHSPALPSVIISKGEDHSCLLSPSGSFAATSSTSSVKVDGSSFSKVDRPKRKAPVAESFVRSEARRDDAKSDIQVLVKLSLKLLAGDRKLDVKEFKEIARLATYSIMAACGLEQPKPGSHSFPGSVCWHMNQFQNQRRMSTLMPNCCRECFHVFVKDVVNSITVERIGSACH